MPQPDAPGCEPGFVNLCAQTPRNEDFVVATTEINTGTDTRCVALAQANGPELCLFYFNKVEVQAGGLLTVYGPRPFALAAKGSMQIHGRIDAGSKATRNMQPGAGGSPTSPGLCAFGTAPQTAGGGGGGGAGGTFATQGGAGGLGNDDGIGGGMSDRAGGTPGPVFDLPKFLRGGCDGQSGAAGDPPAGAEGGRGGGGVYLAAASMQVTGAVLTGGAGGLSATGKDDGGAGGGSGGFIVLQAGSLAVSGTLLATGGGGGKGANDQNDGATGGDATMPTAAPGGSLGNGGGNGGNGATSGMGSPGIENNGGGGGGGGGAGFILLIGASIDTSGATIVPMATQRTK
jgi:hypothetical protein